MFKNHHKGLSKAAHNSCPAFPLARNVSLVATILAPLLTGCDNPQRQAERQAQAQRQAELARIEAAERAQKEAKRREEITTLTAEATEVREERLYIVQLKFSKSQMTLDLLKHMKNGLLTTYEDVVVGRSTFDSWTLDRPISSQDDVWGFVSKGELSSYQVTPVRKTIERQYFMTLPGRAPISLSETDYQLAKQLFIQSTNNGPVQSVEYENLTTYYRLGKDYTPADIVSHKQLTRYYVEVKIANSSFTLSPIKHLRNASTAHTLFFEVPQSVYERSQHDQLWDPKVNGMAVLFKGHVSELRGTIVSRRTAVDTNFITARLKDGREIILPK